METLQYNHHFSSSWGTEAFHLPIPTRQHHHSSSTAPHPIPPPRSCNGENLFKYVSASPPQERMSPVTSISHTLNSLAVESPLKQELTPRSFRMSNVRRNLSLSMDDITRPPDVDEEESPRTPRLPPTPELLFPLDDDNDLVPSNTSPYKSPKRTREMQEEEEEHARREEREAEAKLDSMCSSADMERIKEEALMFAMSDPTPIVRSSSAGMLLGGEYKKKHRPRSLLMRSEEIPRHKENQPACILPTIPSCAHPDLSFITSQTVVDLMSGKYVDSIAEHFIIDCRFPYEYEGGHIKSALNLTENQMKQMFIDNPVTHKKIAIIFHCEFSSQRAPRCCRFLRELDRKLNIADYPNLTYPDVYVIDGGYKKFFETFQDYCDGTYVEMRDERHSMEMKAHCGKLRTIKRARSLSADCFSSLVAQTTSKYG